VGGRWVGVWLRLTTLGMDERTPRRAGGVAKAY